MNPAQLERHGNEDADEHESPRQVPAEKALDNRGHQRRLRRRDVLRPDAEHVVQIDRGDADHERRRQHADDEPDLLVDRRGAHEVSRFQILRRAAGVGGRNAHHRGHREGQQAVARMHLRRQESDVAPQPRAHAGVEAQLGLAAGRPHHGENNQQPREAPLRLRGMGRQIGR